MSFQGRKISEWEDEELTDQQKAKARWTKMEAVIGHPRRIKNVARDIVTH